MRRLSGNESCARPRHVVALACRWSEGAAAPGEAWHRWHLEEGAAVYARLVGYDQTRISVVRWDSPEKLWAWLVGKTGARHTLWVWAYRLPDVLGSAGLWQEIEAGHQVLAWDRRRRCKADGASEPADTWTGVILDSDPPAAVVLRTQAGALVKYVDTRNWFPDWQPDDADPRDAAQQVMDKAVSLSRWLTDHDLGVQRYTIGAQALSAFRHGRMPHPPACDERPAVREHERMAMHHPFQHCYFIGRVAERIYRLDMTGAYTWCYRQPLYPVRLWRCVVRPDLYRVASWAEGRAVIAEIETHKGARVLPYLGDGKPVWRAGSGRCVLPGPELLPLIRAGQVKRCAWAFVYDAAPVLTAFGRSFWGIRQGCKVEGKTEWAALAKSLTNALWGKLSQTGGRWRTVAGRVMPHPWGVTHRRNPETKEVTRERSVGHTCQRYESGEGAWWSMPSIGAYVTSYHRERMREAVAVAGPRCVLYQDTDCIHVLEPALERLEKAGFMRPETPGCFKVEGKADSAEYRGYQVYRFGDAEWLCGLPEARVPVGEGTWRAKLRLRLSAALAQGKPGDPVSWEAIVHDPSPAVRCRLTESGWTEPLEE